MDLQIFAHLTKVFLQIMKVSLPECKEKSYLGLMD